MVHLGLHTVSWGTKLGFCRQEGRGIDTAQARDDVMSATGSEWKGAPAGPL